MAGWLHGRHSMVNQEWSLIGWLATWQTLIGQSRVVNDWLACYMADTQRSLRGDQRLAGWLPGRHKVVNQGLSLIDPLATKQTLCSQNGVVTDWPSGYRADTKWSIKGGL